MIIRVSSSFIRFISYGIHFYIFSWMLHFHPDCPQSTSSAWNHLGKRTAHLQSVSVIYWITNGFILAKTRFSFVKAVKSKHVILFKIWFIWVGRWWPFSVLMFGGWSLERMEVKLLIIFILKPTDSLFFINNWFKIIRVPLWTVGVSGGDRQFGAANE